ncbi:hypothetical protein [Vibrio sp.]|uniref:hypothetical protein n=1 Tax=Vibrio sp. TaxID=678 RepID=UPI003D10433A
MAKQLCKWRRAEIVSQLADIERIVAAPAFVCRSCARAAASKSQLCKPVSLSHPAEKPKLRLHASPAVTEQVASSTAVQLEAQPHSKMSKKERKKQHKVNKKMAKLVRKQQKLVKKQRKLQKQFAALQQVSLAGQMEQNLTAAQVH